ncbi:hypothetical protein C2E23DRAFT_888184 [Lenzites betulinus]|nr:hypothetical protein C2E23DRAFT_888184 [Lenzites betulinus]
MSSKSKSKSKSAAKLALKAHQSHLSRLSDSIVYKPPYCQGTIKVAKDDLALYYGTGENARHADLADAPVSTLQRLAEACDPATFGLGHQDVYDEAYRKAGKLDASKFMLRLSPDTLGLMDIIRTELIYEGDAKLTSDSIRAELYKLNVYGPQSFFKAHVDTPRSELMFGSLVIVFQTSHEGGALVLRERKGQDVREWTFDSATLLAKADRPSIAYVAFYSDVEHEVMPVQSGYRVTITYNLYSVEEKTAETTTVPAAFPLPTNEDSFRETFRGLLNDQTFLPEGGNLMFALRHQYPLSVHRKGSRRGREDLQAVASRLKATDALVYKVMRELSLDASFKIVYEEHPQFGGINEYVMCDQVVDLGSNEVEDSLCDFLESAGGIKLLDSRFARYRGPGDDGIEVHWVARLPPLVWWSINSTQMTYMAYGNQAELAYTYWKISLFVPVGPFGNRATAKSVPRVST